MVTVKAGVARDQFPEIINRAAYAKERTVVTRRDKEVAAVVPIEDLRLLQEIENHMDVEEALEALKEAREKGTISLESLKAELGL
ncbi:MAG TPA: type II toxin-antitoxin system prevent-host-death family antitoxin [Chloroflexota bacterium]|nr:type II toxin-antitoxin system prevent-host-death family antitoxin [Chloroflexota bacterium]